MWVPLWILLSWVLRKLQECRQNSWHVSPLPSYHTYSSQSCHAVVSAPVFFAVFCMVLTLLVVVALLHIEGLTSWLACLFEVTLNLVLLKGHAILSFWSDIRSCLCEVTFNLIFSEKLSIFLMHKQKLTFFFVFSIFVVIWKGFWRMDREGSTHNTAAMF